MSQLLEHSTLYSGVLQNTKMLQVLALSTLYFCVLDQDTINKITRKCKEMLFYWYLIRGQFLKRAPKREFYFDVPVAYRWGQQKACYEWGEPMHDWMLELRQVCIKLSDGKSIPNHCIIIRYDDGMKTFAPPHHDKQDGNGTAGARDIVADTSIWSFVFGVTRRFDLLSEDDGVYENLSKKPSTMEYARNSANEVSHVKWDKTIYKLEWSHSIKPGECFRLDPETNKKYKHAVPKSKEYEGERYSVIFRTIKN